MSVGTRRPLCPPLGFPGRPFVAQLPASSPEEAETTIRSHEASSGVDARAGLIEQADGGILYLDELHNLPLRLQRSLLRFAEDGLFSRIGETKARPAIVRFLFGTNRPVDAGVSDGLLADDLVARTHRIFVPPLSQRRADVPAIFLAAMEKSAAGVHLTTCEWRDLLAADHLEALVLHDTGKGNVRLLEDLAATLAARLAGTAPAERRATIARLFAQRLEGSPVHSRAGHPAPGDGSTSPGGRVSPYEQHREQIVGLYRQLGGSLSAVEIELRRQGINLHRRWLADFLERWGVRKRRFRPVSKPAGEEPTDEGTPGDDGKA